jgi:hypothetical protein
MIKTSMTRNTPRAARMKPVFATRSTSRQRSGVNLRGVRGSGSVSIDCGPLGIVASRGSLLTSVPYARSCPILREQADRTAPETGLPNAHRCECSRLPAVLSFVITRVMARDAFCGMVVATETARSIQWVSPRRSRLCSKYSHRQRPGRCGRGYVDGHCSQALSWFTPIPLPFVTTPEPPQK